jgi:hypothetical protein
VGTSLWDQKENAEAYNRGTYPQVQKALAKVVEGTAEIKTYEVANSTFQDRRARLSSLTGTGFFGGGGQARPLPRCPARGKSKSEKKRGFKCLQES